MRPIIICTLGALLVFANPDPSWIALNMTVEKRMTDVNYVNAEVPVSVGSPPQTVSMTVNLGGDLLAAWSTDCGFCPGATLFDPELSSTFHMGNRSWPNSNSLMSGAYVSDIISFEGVVNASRNDFVLIDNMSTNVQPRVRNGHIGVFVSQNASQRYSNIFSSLWDAHRILNPVVGLRFDPIRPKMTIGALDPSDYEGEINWVQMEVPDTKTWDFFNVVKIDGIKGANGSFVPYGDSPLAALNCFSRNIVVPNTTPYVADINMTGNISGTIHLSSQPISSGLGYDCTLSSRDDSGSAPYVDMTVSINGVDYMLDSKDNMIRPPSVLSSTNVCNVALINRTSLAAPDIVLGMPFLRSVYIAYRFPTGDCPGYYGFAFPSGLNRTEAQKAQKPRTTPSSASQCLNLIKPTSTPSPLPVALSRGGRKLSPSTYSVFKHKEEGQVHLVGWEELAKGKWNIF